MEFVGCRPSGHRSVKSSTSERGEEPEASQVARLIHPKTAPVPVSSDIGACGIVRRSDLRGARKIRRRWVSVPPPTALREVRLSGFPEALVDVRRHRVGGRGRRVPDAAPAGFSDARFIVEPAYSLGPHSVRPLRRLAGGRAPSDPRTGNGAP